MILKAFELAPGKALLQNGNSGIRKYPKVIGGIQMLPSSDSGSCLYCTRLRLKKLKNITPASPKTSEQRRIILFLPLLVNIGKVHHPFFAVL